MLLQFSGDDIFLQLLANVAVIVLAYLDYTFDVAVNGLDEHLLYQHGCASSIHELEGSVVVVVLDFAKEQQILPAVFPGIEHHDGNIIDDLMEIVEYGV